MKLSKKIFASVAVAALTATLSQGAAARDFADIYTECGLGAMIAPNNAAVAAVTNVTWDLGSTAISSDYSSANNCKGGKAKTASLILHTYPQLEQDLARGTGEHLSAVLATAGCTAASRDAVTASLRSSLATRASQAGDSEATRVERAKAVYSDLSATASCTI
jgi:aspartokinase